MRASNISERAGKRNDCWIISGATLRPITVAIAAMCVFALAAPVCEAGTDAGQARDRFDPAQERLEPFVLPWDDGSPGPTDLSDWNHRPAGSHGPITAGDDGRLYAGDEHIRFFGVNVNFAGCFPTHDEAEKIAARMAKFGINVVRFHHMDRLNFPRGLWDADAGGAPHFHDEALDRLDYFVAQLRDRGIYVNMNLMVRQEFGPAHGLPEEAEQVTGKANHLLAFFHDQALEIQKDYAARLLGRENAYTGLSYAEDPAVAFVEIVNENGIVNYWFDSRRRPRLEELPEIFRRPLLDRWRAFLAERYADEAELSDAWDARTVEDVDLVPFEGFQDRREIQRLDWLEFLRELERGYYVAMRDHLRDELKVAGLIMGSTAGSSTLNVQAELDVIDGHVYFENPRWRAGTWNWRGKQWSIANASHTGSPAGRLRWLGMYQVAGMPYSVTEFNQAAPSVYGAEAPIYLATHGALQDWDALYLFAYAHDADWDSRIIMGLDIDQHPTKMANMLAAAAVFRRGDLAPARHTAAAWISPRRELEIMAESGRPWGLAHGFDVGLSGDDVMRHRVEVHVGELAPQLPPNVAYAENPPRILSDTGELYWHRYDRRGSTYLVVDTDRTKSVLGLTGGRRFDLGEVSFEVGETLDGPTVSMVLLDGESFGDSPRRALLVACGRVENRGMKWRIVEERPEAPYELKSWGGPPTVIESVPARVTVPGEAASVEVYALDEQGQRGERLEVDPVGGGRSAFEIGPPHYTLWYEVVWRDGVEATADEPTDEQDHSPER